MKLAKLEIQGFRGVRFGEISFGDFSVLIGANNCGKTTVIEALALLFGRDRLIRTLTEHDFFGSNPEPAERIKPLFPRWGRFLATSRGDSGIKINVLKF